MQKATIILPVSGYFADYRHRINTEVVVTIECEFESKSRFTEEEKRDQVINEMMRLGAQYSNKDAKWKWDEAEVGELIRTSDFGKKIASWMDKIAKNLYNRKQDNSRAFFELPPGELRRNALESEEGRLEYRFLKGGHKGKPLEYFDFDDEVLQALASHPLTQSDGERELYVQVTKVQVGNVTWKMEVSCWVL